MIDQRHAAGQQQAPPTKSASMNYTATTARHRRLPSCRELVAVPVRVALRGPLLELVLHGHGAALGLRSLPRLLQSLLVVIRVDEPIHRVLLSASRVSVPHRPPPGALLRAWDELEGEVVREGVQDKGAEADR